MIRCIGTALLVAVIASVPDVSYASVFGSHSTTTQSKSRMVKLTLRNRTSEPMKLLVEDKPITIAANSTYDLKAPEGTHVYAVDKSMKLLVTRDLDGTTCSFR